ncbi:hypothetical protein AABB24_037803 [Solanum stoloniferum]|uniref:Association with the SNF1 complex (ASC) domain-containing protein n=1 Tax=Solanum stoloniferum TaxID=62892 RepID=A0ABD2QUY7_9SOLN
MDWVRWVTFGQQKSVKKNGRTLTSTIKGQLTVVRRVQKTTDRAPISMNWTHFIRRDCLTKVLERLRHKIRIKTKYISYLVEHHGYIYMPVVPLRRPEELHISNPSWMQNTSGYEDLNDEQGVPTLISWTYDGKEVAVEGSWDNWKSRNLLQRSGKDFTILKVLPSGVYQYRFIVDGQWRCSPDLPCVQDEAGNTYNILDMKDYVPEDIESISGFEPPLSPDSSYSNLQLGAEDYAKEPPLVPPHLQMTLLNVPSSPMEIPPPFSRPQHVVLNHLYMQKGKSTPSVVALGSTNRFLSKYVTVVLYKSIQR